MISYEFFFFCGLCFSNMDTAQYEQQCVP